MTPIILFTMNELGKELIKHASAVTETDCDKDIHYVDYTWKTSPSQFVYSMETALFLSFAKCVEEEHKCKSIIIFSDLFTEFSDIIYRLKEYKDCEVIYIPTINIPMFIDVLYKRSVYKTIDRESIKSVIRSLHITDRSSIITINGEPMEDKTLC